MTKTAVPHAKSTPGKKRSRGRSPEESSERPVVLIRLPDIRQAEAGAPEQRLETPGSQPQPPRQAFPADDSSSPRGAAESERPAESAPVAPQAAEPKDMPWSPPAEPWLGNPPTKRLLQIAAAATLIVLVISAYLVATAVRPGRVVVTPADRPSEPRLEIPHLPPPDFTPAPASHASQVTQAPAQLASASPPALPTPEESADTKPAAGPELLEPLTASPDSRSGPKPSSEGNPPTATKPELPSAEPEKPDVPQPGVGALEVLEPSTAPQPQPTAPAPDMAAAGAPSATGQPEPAVPAEPGAESSRSYPVTDPATFQYPAYQDLFRAAPGQTPPGSDRWQPYAPQPNTARLQPGIEPPPMR